MARWTRGEAEIERFIAADRLQQVTGEAANGKPLLDRAIQMLNSARAVAAADADSAFVLAYDAARTAASALLMQQGLRPTTAGGHIVVEEATKAQFGTGFRDFGALRRRRNELEYFKRSGDFATTSEATDSIGAAQKIIDGAEGLIDKLGLF